MKRRNSPLCTVLMTGQTDLIHTRVLVDWSLFSHDSMRTFVHTMYPISVVGTLCARVCTLTKWKRIWFRANLEKYFKVGDWHQQSGLTVPLQVSAPSTFWHSGWHGKQTPSFANSLLSLYKRSNEKLLPCRIIQCQLSLKMQLWDLNLPLI